MASTHSGSSLTPWAVTWWLRKSMTSMPKVHFVTLTTFPWAANFWKSRCRWRQCSLASAMVTKSVIYVNKKEFLQSPTHLVHKSLKSLCSILSPNGIRRNLKWLKSVITAVFSTSAAATRNWLYPRTKSIFEKISCPSILQRNPVYEVQGAGCVRCGFI